MKIFGTKIHRVQRLGSKIIITLYNDTNFKQYNCGKFLYTRVLYLQPLSDSRAQLYIEKSTPHGRIETPLIDVNIATWWGEVEAFLGTTNQQKPVMSAASKKCESNDSDSGLLHLAGCMATLVRGLVGSRAFTTGTSIAPILLWHVSTLLEKLRGVVDAYDEAVLLSVTEKEANDVL